MPDVMQQSCILFEDNRQSLYQDPATVWGESYDGVEPDIVVLLLIHTSSAGWREDNTQEVGLIYHSRHIATIVRARTV
jgi:hypothetical protein